MVLWKKAKQMLILSVVVCCFLLRKKTTSYFTFDILRQRNNTLRKCLFLVENCSNSRPNKKGMLYFHQRNLILFQRTWRFFCAPFFGDKFEIEFLREKKILNRQKLNSSWSQVTESFEGNLHEIWYAEKEVLFDFNIFYLLKMN